MSVQVWEPGATKPSGRLQGMIRLLPGGSIVASRMAQVDRVVDQVPVLAWARTRLYELEEEALLALRDRLGQLDGALPVGSLTPFTQATKQPSVSVVPRSGSDSPAEAFATLLKASETQSPDAARQQSVMRIITELVPDEARILLTLSNGSQHAVLQVHDGEEQLVQNRSSVGRAAKVHAQDLTARYVTHLLELDLVELTPYAGRAFYEWEMIETETVVREVLSRYDHRKLRKPKLTRQVLRLSPAGRAFCDLCIPL